MKTELEIKAEIARCEIEKEKHEACGVDWRMYNDRMWALKWALQTQEVK